MQGASTWNGIYPAALTMFDQAGKLDLDASGEHIVDLVDQGAHGVVIGGTSGEFISLSDQEKLDLFRVTVEVVAGRVPVIVGTGTAATGQTIELTNAAGELGVDGAIVILPYYQRPNRQEVLEHYRKIARSVSLPIMLYNNPANSGTDALEAPDIGVLAQEGVLQAVKSTFPTVHQVHEVRGEVPDTFRVFYGSFMAPLEGLAGGAHGWISGILNVVLADAIELWEAISTSNLELAHKAWARIQPYNYLYTRKVLGSASDLAIWREVLRIRGKTAGFCRAPLLELNDEQRQLLRRTLDVDRQLQDR